MVQVTAPADVHIDHSSFECYFRIVLSRRLHNIAECENGAEGVIFAIHTAAQVALILGDKNVGSLLVKLGEVNLVLDQNSEVLGVF